MNGAEERSRWTGPPQTSHVVSAGSVKFQPISAESTEVEVKLQYDPPAHKAGAVMASLAGAKPASVVQEDLQRLKDLLEAREGQR